MSRGYRAAKLLGLACAGLLALAVAAIVALRVLFPPAKIKALALERLQAALQREVRVNDASIGLGGLTLSGLEISELPGFSAGTLVSADSLSASVRWKPLLRERRIEVVSLSLKRPRLSLRRAKDGTWNYAAPRGDPATPRGATREEKGSATPAEPAGAAKGGEPARESPVGAVAAPAIAVDSLELSEGEILYADAASGSRAALRSVSLWARDLRPDRPFEAALGLEYELGGKKDPLRGKLEFDGSVDPGGGDPAKLAITARSLALSAGELSARLEGSLRGAATPELDLRFALPELTRQNLAPHAALPEGLRLPPTKGRLRARVDGAGVDIRELSLAGEGLELALKARQRGEDWRLEPSRLAWGSLELTASGGVRVPPKGEPSLDLALKTGRVELAKLPEPLRERLRGAAGAARLELTLKGPAGAPAYAGVAELDGFAYEAAGQRFTGLTGKASFDAKRVDAAVAGKWNGEALDLKVSAQDYAGKSPRYTLHGRLAALDLNSLPSEPGAKPARGEGDKDGGKPAAERKPGPAVPLATSGNIVVGAIRHPHFQAGETKLDWDLAGLTPDLRGLGGKISLTVGPGRFDDLKALVGQKPMVKLALLPIVVLQRAAGLVKVPLFPNFDRVAFKEIVGDYELEKGNLKVKRSYLDSDAAYATLAGEADLGQDALNLRVETRLPSSLGGKVAGNIIAFKVRGSLADPRVSVDPLAILKQPAVSDTLEKGKKLGEEIIRGLFK